MIRIIWVGVAPGVSRYRKLNVVEDDVSTLDPAFFMSNKVQVSRSDARRVVFIDTDTLVLKPLHRIWDGVTEDIIARPAERYEDDSFDRTKWEDLLETIGARHFYPYFNSGFVVYNNGAHKKVRDPWLKLTNVLRHEASLPIEQIHEKKNSNQMALSLAIAKLGLSYKLMSADEHSYGWSDAFSPTTVARTVLFHTGSWTHLHFANKLGRRAKLPWLLRSRIWMLHKVWLLHLGIARSAKGCWQLATSRRLPGGN